MNNELQTSTTERIQAILHRALVEIRNLTAAGAVEQACELADTVEALPLLVLRWDDEQAKQVRPSLLRYETKYPGSLGRYTMILDMEERAFQQRYLAKRFDWSEADLSGVA